MIRGVLVLAMLALAAPASAEDIVGYEAEGEAPASAGDARVAALDDAFARAVSAALADLVAADVRTAHKADLDREVVGHARLWVAKFTVTKDETNEDRRQLAVSVRVDRDKLRARLGELHVATVDAPPPEAPPAHSATILLRVQAGGGARASFGAGADKDTPGLVALTSALRDAAFAVRRAPATGPAPRADGDLPVDDADAAALAAGAEAEVAVVAGVSIGAAVPVRGQAGTAELITAHVALVERDSRKAVAHATATAAAQGEDAGLVGYAIDHAVVAAARDVIPQGPQHLAQAGAFHGDDTPLGDRGIVLIRLPAKTPWGMVQTELRYLSGARGVHGATLRRASPAGWVIGVTTEQSIDAVAQLAKHPPMTDTGTAVKIVGAVVELELSGAP